MSPALKRAAAIVLGLALGGSLAVSYLPGGYDALNFYLKAPAADTTAPAWVYLLTYPLSLLPWPLGWQVLTFLTIVCVGAAALAWGNRRWWIVLVTPALLWTIWLGQIEVFPVLGLLLTALVTQKKLHPAWLGLSWLALLTKPQVGLGVLVFQAIWLARDVRGAVRLVLPGLVVFAAVFGVTLLLWPGWIARWVATMRGFAPDYWNAAIWPIGLLAWPAALLVFRRAAPLQQLRLFSAAGLLGSPYFALYHCLLLLTVTDSLLALPLAWGILFIGLGTPEVWQGWGWLLPVGLLALDVGRLLLARRTAAAAATAPVPTP